MYIYISQDKVENLMGEMPRRRRGWFKELAFALKSPYAEAKVSLNLDKTMHDNVRQIKAYLSEDDVVSDVDAAGSKPFFSFKSSAHRAIESEALFFVALNGTTAILLAGSPSNAIGTPVKASNNVSPSIDFVGAVRRAFSDLSDAEATSVGENCSYLWSALARPVKNSWTQLPRLEGIAVYGGTYSATRGQFRRAGFPDVERIVVGSPIFVKQAN